MNKDQQLPELPEEIWRKVFLDLDWKDIRNLHLTSSQFHRAANTYPHKLWIVNDDLIASMFEVLNQSSRHYETINIISNFIRSESGFIKIKYHHVKELFQKFGDGVKILRLGGASISEQDVYKILVLLPNLKYLEMFRAKITQEQKIEMNSIDLPKLETVMILRCDGDLSSFLLSLKCKITEFEADGSGRSIYVLDKWQSTVKKLKIKASLCTELEKLLALKLEDLRLEDLSFKCQNLEPPLQLKFQTFFGQFESLKHLDLNTGQLNNDILLNAICESLQKLESLKIDVTGTFTNASIRNISKLKCLRSLTASPLDMVDLLNALNLEVNENFEELVVQPGFVAIFLDHSRLPENLNEKIPNLKKVDIVYKHVKIVAFFFKNFKGLENFSAKDHYFREFFKYNGKILEIISHLHMDYNYSEIFASLPDLEVLKISCHPEFADCEDLMQVLRHFPNLKKFIIILKDFRGQGEFSMDVADLILEYGKNLREIEIPYRCDEEEVCRKLKDMNLKFTCLDFCATFPKTDGETKGEMELAPSNSV